jgi:hypothetical protein
MWKLGAGMLDHDKYNVIEIGEYLARHIPLIQELPVLSQSIPGMEVCSELDAILLRAGGLPGLHPALTSPQVLAELRIYDECVQLAGPPEAIPGFNTV